MVLFVIISIAILSLIYVSAFRSHNTREQRIKKHFQEKEKFLQESLKPKTLLENTVEAHDKWQKLSPRDKEKFWFDLWLERWQREVGSEYVPLEGMADYVEPKKALEQANPGYLSLEGSRHPAPVMLTNGVRLDPTKRTTIADVNDDFAKMMFAWSTENVNEMRRIKQQSEAYRREDSSFHTYQAELERVSERRKAQRLRYQIDPHSMLNDYQYERVRSALDKSGYIVDGSYVSAAQLREKWNKDKYSNKTHSTLYSTMAEQEEIIEALALSAKLIRHSKHL